MKGITKPYAFKASDSDPDTLSYDDIMANVDRELWMEVIKKMEIQALQCHGTWTEVEFGEATSRIKSMGFLTHVHPRWKCQVP